MIEGNSLQQIQRQKDYSDVGANKLVKRLYRNLQKLIMISEGRWTFMQTRF